MADNYNEKYSTLHNYINSSKMRSEGWLYFLKFSKRKVYVYLCVYIHIYLLISSLRFLYQMSAYILEQHFGNNMYFYH